MKLNNKLKLEQKHILVQKQIQSLEILAMCNADLKTFLENEYSENPLLSSRDDSDATNDIGRSVQNMHTENYGVGSTGRKNKSNYADDDTENIFLENLEGKNEAVVEQYFTEQINPRNKRESDIFLFLIRNLDRNGYYTVSLEETAEMLGVRKEEVSACLLELQQLEPAGCFQKDLPSSLIAQLEALGIENETLDQIIRENLEDIGNNRFNIITRKYNITTEQARKYKAIINSLNPRPLSVCCEETVSYIIPDVIVRGTRENFEIVLNDDWIGKYGLNDYYIKMIENTSDEELKQYFKEKMERASFVLNGIEQRRNTILSITEEIVRRQAGFIFEKQTLSVMTMKSVAEQLKISASTVSRALKDKYLQYPGGIAKFADLFTLNVSKGECCSSQEIKKVLVEIIKKENFNAPYSDSALEKILKEKGIIISRRGIAKYRGELGIPGSADRRKK